MEPRRRDARVPIEGWHGRCAVADEPPLEWTECEVVDVSLLGAGVDIWADSGVDLTGYRLMVEVQPPGGDSVVLRFSGRVTRISHESAFHSRVGLVFEHLSESERSILEVIERIQRVAAGDAPVTAEPVAQVPAADVVAGDGGGRHYRT
jgi:hypothetical protein